MSRLLAVRNQAQKILFDEELSGQISDGAWENAVPHNHWQVWCDARVVVDPEHLGRNFYAVKANYDFARKDLLEIVGERMLEAVRKVRPDYTYNQMVMDLRDLKDIVRVMRNDIPEPPPDPRVVAAEAAAEAARAQRKQILEGIINDLRYAVEMSDTPTYNPDPGYPYAPARASQTAREFEMLGRDGKRYVISVRQEDV